ncbi:hypothetical protein H0H92_010742 [Tricholoma furcatifolium]|nr:hypothetical protein H0H92_010742 [Tricholoma furcatifolium]
MSVMSRSNPSRLPIELQRLIFEAAAKEDRRTARQIGLVARYVRNWVEPILYACVIVRSQKHAAALLDVIHAKPRYFYGPIVKSLGISDSVTLQQSKAILIECSQEVVDLAVWTNSTRNPTVFLPFVRSYSVERLSLKSQHPSELSIPPNLLASLTHLMILDGPYTWFQMREAARHGKIKRACNPECASASGQFGSLTHFAVCSQNWGSMQSILNVAMNLKYFVIVVSPQFKAAPLILRRIREIGDRRMVLVEYLQTVENWEDSVRGAKRSIWECAEKLVDSGYLAEETKWNA